MQAIVAERATWASQIAQVKHMHGWVLDVEPILDGSWAQKGEEVSNAMVGSHLDAWRQQMAKHLTDGTLSELEQKCLAELLRVRTSLRPYLVQCSIRTDFPRTNNDRERSIRRLKTQYRRISGRKNWNAYLVRSGRCVAYAAWWEQDGAHRQQFEQRVAKRDHAQWRALRQETTAAHSEQLTRFRFRHKRQAFLTSLEARWEATAPTPLLP
ncbi:MAG: hypothetical protein ABI234_09145 [Ktedonobacteraceae bacterium]